jgi:hypothetical protein
MCVIYISLNTTNSHVCFQDLGRTSFLLNNQEGNMSHNEIFKYVAPKMPRIILERAEEIFPALKENVVCCREN